MKSDSHSANSTRDYYAFGMQMPGRNFTSTGYRYSFNGKEKDDEIHGNSGDAYDFGARLYDARLGRWTAVDPSSRKYPAFSPYNFCANNPIIYIDPDGKEIIYVGTPAQVEAAKNLVSQAGKSSNLQTIINKLDASDVKYYILVGSEKEIQAHTGQGGVDFGGVTAYDFSKEKEGVVIGIENVNSTAPTQLAAIADELKTGEQFEEGKLGFAQSADGEVYPVGYDPTDELDTKIAASEALTANQLSSKDLDGPNSKKIIAAYENTPKDAQGKPTPEGKKSLLDVLWGTAYKATFKALKVGKEENVTAAEGAAKAESKGHKTVRREKNKTVSK